jgi:hypothetical protein
MNRSPGNILLCEPMRRWAILWHRFCPRIGIQELPSLTLLKEAVAVAPRAMVLLAVNEANMNERLTFMLQQKWEHPLLVWSVILEAEIADAAPFFTAAGVQFIVTEYADLIAVARAAQRHRRRLPHTPRIWNEPMQAKLPW